MGWFFALDLATRILLSTLGVIVFLLLIVVILLFSWRHHMWKLREQMKAMTVALADLEGSTDASICMLRTLKSGTVPVAEVEQQAAVLQGLVDRVKKLNAIQQQLQAPATE
jgi:sensor histidine kinase regulating citrate/malate metabolism